MTSRQSHAAAFLLLSLICTGIPRQAASFELITYGDSKDRTIGSDKYPDGYSAGANVTWSWSVSSGYWAVFFLDFDLDRGLDGYGDGDQLEISDGYRTPRYHSARNPPVVPYRSRGSRLRISFTTDSLTGDSAFRGFQLRVLL
ncbi:hypothetical protein EGW08_014382 [Elysia chlorotica]|uniref:CUB domain-containing protein n=1 Tax=Elysia chlorotica TaxID=188477 RepID=A0A3S1B8V1_ELYCH|nr:hypothetical protein EGW08_014382 [Elysia chlorotica]